MYRPVADLGICKGRQAVGGPGVFTPGKFLKIEVFVKAFQGSIHLLSGSLLNLQGVIFDPSFTDPLPRIKHLKVQLLLLQYHYSSRKSNNNG